MKNKILKNNSFTIIIFGIITFLILNISCTEITKKNDQQNVKNVVSKHLIIKKPGSSYKDTIVINFKSAVFYTPDSLQMEKIKAVNEKNIFDMIIHDCHYQMQNAKLVLQQYWPKVSIIETSKARYLLFIKSDNSKVCIDLNNKNDICGVILFQRNKEPILADMPNINTVLGFYFSN
jgi:hypothetical protein